MVFIATPLHDIACPVVYVDLGASLPDFLGETVAEILEHCARTLLPEYSLYKYANIAPNIEDEIKAKSFAENKRAKNFGGEHQVQALAELPGPGRALIRQLEHDRHSKKPCKLKTQPLIIKSLLPRSRLETFLDKPCPTLPEPILDVNEGESSHNKPAGLTRALVADLGIQNMSTSSPFSLNNEEKDDILSQLRFRPQAISTALPSLPRSALEILTGKQPATQLPSRNVFLSEFIQKHPANSNADPSLSSLLKASSQELPHIFLEKNPPVNFPVPPVQLRALSSDTSSNCLRWKPHKRGEGKGNFNRTKQKLPSALFIGEVVAADGNPLQSWTMNKRKRLQIAEDQLINTVENIGEKPILIAPIEVPLLPQHLKEAAVNNSVKTSSPLYPLAAFPELLQLPPGATDLALGFITTTKTNNTNNKTNTAQNSEACTLLWDLVAKEMMMISDEGDLFLSPMSPTTLTTNTSGVITALHALYQNSFLGVHNSLNNMSLSVVGEGVVGGMMRECNVEKASTGSLELVLDWSLSTQQASLRKAELLDVCRRVKRSMGVGVQKKNKKNAEAGTTTSSAALVLSSLLAPFAVHSLESKSEVSLLESPSSFDGSVVVVAEATAVGDGALAATPFSCNNILQKSNGGGGGGGNELDARPAKRLKLQEGTSTIEKPNAAPVSGGLGFFMQLQRGVGAGGKGDGAPAALENNNNNIAGSVSLMSSDDLSDFLPQSNSLQTITVALPPTHLNLLHCLNQADTALLSTVPYQFLPPGVTSENFLELEHIRTALHTAPPPSSSYTATTTTTTTRPVLKVLAGLAILRQTAKLVMHHGIRAAYMYFSSSIQELPGIFNSLNNNIAKNGGGRNAANGGKSVAHALEVAAGRVEAGQEEDHPKHTALRQTLMTINTLAMGSKILVVGDPKSFFTLYSVVHAAGLRPCHLDREGQLLSSTQTTSSDSLEAVFGEAVEHACTVSDCVLAAAGLILKALSSLQTREMVLHSFQHIVVYVSEPEMQQQVLEKLKDHHSSAAAAATMACSVTVLTVQQVVFESSTQPQNEAVEEEKAAAAAPAAAAEVITLKAAATTKAPSAPDWPLVLSNSTLRPIKSRTDLYEGIITLENEGTVIIERAMRHLDMVLSPSAALIILTEEAVAATSPTAATAPTTANGPDFELFLQHITPIFERIGRAFSKLHLVCEGSTGFRAQILSGMPRLVSSATQCHLTLQCDVTADARSTCLTVRSIATSYLQEWKQRRLLGHPSGGLQHRNQPNQLYYSIGDPPCAVETCLAAIPSVNPHSAAVLAGCGLTLQQLFSLSSLESSSTRIQKIPAVLGLVPKHSMQLFNECCTAGRALGGGQTATAASPGGVLQPPPPPSMGPSHYAPAPPPPAPPRPQYQHDFPVYDLPESLDEFIKASVSVAAAADVVGAPVAGLGNHGDLNSGEGHQSAASMPDPSWCGPQLGTGHYVQQHQQFKYEEEQQYYHHQQQQQPSFLNNQGEELDEFGVPVDPLASWQELDNDNSAARYSFNEQQQQQHFQQQQQGYNDGYEHSYYQADEQEAVSGYAPPWIESGMPLPGLDYPTTMRGAPPRFPTTTTSMLPPPLAPRPAPVPSYYQQQQQKHPSRPTGSAVVNDDRFSGLSSFQYPQQQHQRRSPPHPPQHPHSNFRGGGGVGGARGYTAAALDRQQQQHAVWPSISTDTGATTGLNGADYMKRKWGGGRGTARRGGGGGRGKGRKYSSRTQRQW